MSLLKSTPNLAGIERHIPSTPLLETCKFYGESTVVSEMNSDFTELASARCDIPNDLVDVTLLHAGEVRKLKTLCIDFLPSGSMIDVSVELKNLKEELHRELPEVDFRHVGRSREFDRKWDERVGKILGKIENLKVEDFAGIYVRFLVISGIFLTTAIDFFSSSLSQATQ